MEDRIVDFFEGKMSRAERIDFLHSLESDGQLKKLFIRMENAHALSCLIPKRQDDAEGREAYGQFRQIARRLSIRGMALKALSYAASIALAIAGTWYFAGKRDAPVQATATTAEVYAPAGQRAKVTLDDGSVVWLNARSSLAYRSDYLNNRHVTLSGEAFFEVESNPDKPFTVAANGVNITALGTKFNVNSYPENGETQISLIEGSVKVWDDAGQALVLEPSRQVLYSNRKPTSKPAGKTVEPAVRKDYGNHKLIPEPIEHEDYFLWTKGVYSFANEPINSVFKKLERYYDVKIKVADPSAFNREFTGKFRQQDGVDMILRIIRYYHPFNFDRKEDIIVITK
jgi:ferric-dicitrate binding protein FerR (iron transport regulator)